MNRNKNKGLVLWILVVAILLVMEVVMLNHYDLIDFSGRDAVESIPSDSFVEPEGTEDIIVPASDTDVSSSDAEVVPEIPEITVPDSVTIQAAGDVLLHGTVTRAASTGNDTYNFEPYFSMLTDAYVADINIVNLETPVDAHGGNAGIEGYPYFNVPYEILPVIKNTLNADIVTTATNHSIDQGYDGLCSTIENCKKEGLTVLGTQITEEEKDVPFILDINGIKVGIICYTAHTNIPIKENIAFSVNYCGNSKEKITGAIIPLVDELRANGAEFIVTVIHWGVEYSDHPTKDQRETAKALCEAGVDVLFGGHSHCVQPIELLEVERGGTASKALVVYSLGNFFSNQTALEIPKTQYGMIVSVKAERGEDGAVRLADAFYMPTYCYVRGGSGENFMRILPSGKFALDDNIAFDDYSDVFKNQAAMESCSSAWRHVLSVVGEDIPAVASPQSYPEGFFSSEQPLS